MEYSRITKTDFYSDSNKIYCRMDDDNKQFSVNNIIHYTGKCNELNNFYAKIDKITSKGIDFTVLTYLENETEILFFLTDIVKKGKTRRPFYLLR